MAIRVKQKYASRRSAKLSDHEHAGIIGIVSRLAATEHLFEIVTVFAEYSIECRKPQYLSRLCYYAHHAAIGRGLARFRRRRAYI